MKIYSAVHKNFSSCRLKFPMKNCRQMSGKSKASDRTNLGTSAAPLIVSTILCSVKFTILYLFSEQPFYENHPTLDSHTRPLTRQDSF